MKDKVARVKTWKILLKSKLIKISIPYFTMLQKSSHEKEQDNVKVQLWSILATSNGKCPNYKLYSVIQVLSHDTMSWQGYNRHRSNCQHCNECFDRKKHRADSTTWNYNDFILDKQSQLSKLTLINILHYPMFMLHFLS